MGNCCFSCLNWLLSCRFGGYEHLPGDSRTSRITNRDNTSHRQNGGGSSRDNRVYTTFEQDSDATPLLLHAHKRRQTEQLQQFPVDSTQTRGNRHTDIRNGTGLNADKIEFKERANFYINSHQKQKPASKRLTGIFHAIRAMLQLRYKKDLMPLFPWMPNYVLRLSKLYVKLTMSPCGTFSEKVPEHDIELKNIFEGSNSFGTRILVEGPPAYGKSTLALKLCQDWANETEEYTKQFELAILIQLRNFSKHSFEEVLMDALRVSWPKAKDREIHSLIIRNGRKTLLVLDGYDELSAGNKQLLCPLLSGQILPEATVIITARPGSYDPDEPTAEGDTGTPSFVNIKSSAFFTSAFQKRIVVKGIQKSQQSEFLYKHLSEKFTEQQVETLYADLSTRYDQKLFECPLFLLLVAILSIETNLAFPRNRSHLYKNLFNFIVQRGLFVLCNFQDRVDLFTFNKECPPFYVDLMSRFSKMALNSVVRRELTFSAEEILCYFKEGDSRILRLGFFTHKESLDGILQTSWYEPVHRTLMEFAAAYYLYLLWKKGEVDDFQNKVRALFDFLPDRYFQAESLVFTFLSGLFENHTSFLFEALKPFRNNYTYWFDSHYSSMLSELELTENVMSDLIPFIDPEWHVNAKRNETFCKSPEHVQIVGFGIRNGIIQTIKWDVNSTAAFPHDTVIPNIELQVSAESNFSYRLQGENVRSANLCCKLLGSDITTMKDENWPDLVTLILEFQPDTLSFEFNSSSSNIYLPSLVEEATKGKLTNVLFKRLKCELQTDKDFMLAQVCKLLETVVVQEVQIILRSHPGISKDLWNDFIQQVSRIEHLLVLGIENSDCSSFVLVDECVLCNGGQKLWKTVELEGFVDLNIAPHSQFHDVTYGAAGEAKYIRARIMNNVRK